MTASFLIATDTHFYAPGTAENMTWWNTMLKEQSPAIAESFISTVRELDPDFIIHCGDLTDNGTPESFRYAKEIMDRLACPYYVSLGNHDTFKAGAREAIAGMFENADGKFYYACDLGGLRFVFLDCAYWIRKDGQEDEHIDWDLYRSGEYLGVGPSRDELNWLAEELGAGVGRPTIVVAHTPFFSKATYPVGALPRGKPVKCAATPTVDFASYCVRHEKLMQTITSPGCVKAVLTGHWHIFDVACNEGIHHCQTGSMIEFPFELRSVEVIDGHMSMSTVGLNDPSFREMSLLHELGNGWVAGESGDRSLEVDLT